MSTLYTAYGYMLGENDTSRQCGMNNLVHLDIKKAPTRKQQDFSIELAKKRGFDTLVFFRGDEVVKRVELW